MIKIAAWGTAGLLFLSAIIESLRYLCLSQNNNYKLGRHKKVVSYFVERSFFFLFIIVSNVLAFFLNEKILYLSLIIAFLNFIVDIFEFFRFRTKFKFTKRGKFYFIFCLIIYIFAYIFFAIFIENIKILISSCVFINTVNTLIIKIIEIPLNKYFCKKNKEYIIKQKNKLLSKNVTVVGITGSYGKTSCKNILKFLLQDDFCIASTKENYNTPMGIAMTIEEMSGNEDILIAEFGARKEGDIEELCELFRPKIGIITGVCEQHVETFGGIGNVYKEKKKLADYVSETSGQCFFNVNDRNAHRMWKEYKGRKSSIALGKQADIYADNISCSDRGSLFTLHIAGREYKCQTNLLGKHNVLNIAVCVAVCVELGINIEKIVEKIALLPQIKHRLEYIYANGIHIIDDSYNANEKGVHSAAETLSLFSGRKIAILQGIVECGKKSYELNENVGKEFASVADLVMLSGTNAGAIENGLNKYGFSGEIIHIKNIKNLNKYIKNYVKKGDVLLLQNDLPDIF